MQSLLNNEKITVKTSYEFRSLMKLKINYDINLVDLTKYFNLQDICLDICYTHRGVNISILEKMTKLKQITIFDLFISDISFCKHLLELTYLDITGNSVTDLTPLYNLNNFTKFCYSRMFMYLDCDKTQICQQISNLQHLQILNVSDSRLSDISPFSMLVELKELNISSNFQISDISALKTLHKLVIFIFCQNKIRNLYALAFMKDLKEINVSGNQIIDVNPLYFCSHITNLNIFANLIIDPTVLKNQNVFKELALSSNKIRDPGYFAKYDNYITYQNQPSVEEVSHANILTHIHNSFMSLYKTQQLMRQKQVRKEIQNLKVQFTAVKTHLITQMNDSVQLLIQFIIE
ncbi:leucine-rich_repeat domain-containing protein [Hexamita inflata]|uniref:Leucine-rich repeat domain-containing protein n=1 Tax=Hexamita inflata TaxID=28002 RepID=A0AA86TL55_9EUKA|nr:leucine-rich repeat domain-containing protein [Hexamita inflata]